MKMKSFVLVWIAVPDWPLNVEANMTAWTSAKVSMPLPLMLMRMAIRSTRRSRSP